MLLGMGIRDVLTGGSNLPGLPNGQLGIVSPWAPPGNLQSVVWSDILGADIVANLPLMRSEAIAIPAVSKARNLIVSTASKWPLVALTKAGILPDADQPTFLYRSSGIVSPYERMAWTLDDAVFYGCSLWLTDRGADDRGRKSILDATYCPWDWWTIRDGAFWLRENGDEGAERRLSPDEYIFINFPFEGLLTIGNRTLRGAREQEIAWVGRAKNPIPLIDLHRTADFQLGDEEAAQLVADWAKARTQPNGAIGSTPEGIELNVYGETDPALFIEGRNAVRTDIGSFLNIRASMLDGTAGVDSLTYKTTEGEKNSFFELDMPFWTDPIEARLSQDDIVPRGQRIRFIKYQAMPELTGPEEQD